MARLLGVPKQHVLIITRDGFGHVYRSETEHAIISRRLSRIGANTGRLKPLWERWSLVRQDRLPADGPLEERLMAGINQLERVAPWQLIWARLPELLLEAIRRFPEARDLASEQGGLEQYLGRRISDGPPVPMDVERAELAAIASQWAEEIEANTEATGCALSAGPALPRLEEQLARHAVKWAPALWALGQPPDSLSVFRDRLLNHVLRQRETPPATSAGEPPFAAQLNHASRPFENLVSTFVASTKAREQRRAELNRRLWELNSLLIDIGEHLGIESELLWWLLPEELVQALRDDRVDPGVCRERRKLCVYRMDGGGEVVLVGEEASMAADEIPGSARATPSAEPAFVGCPASPGRMTGRAVVMLATSDDVSVPSGSVVVAQDAGSDLWTAHVFERAGAIVTEHGGITCHAATIARELRLPCVVGVRGVTTRVRTGDSVTVDGREGRVWLA
jgi:phosphohistidine swiveling domain-containing protein